MASRKEVLVSTAPAGMRIAEIVRQDHLELGSVRRHSGRYTLIVGRLQCGEAGFVSGTKRGEGKGKDGEGEQEGFHE